MNLHLRENVTYWSSYNDRNIPILILCYLEVSHYCTLHTKVETTLLLLSYVSNVEHRLRGLSFLLTEEERTAEAIEKCNQVICSVNLVLHNQNLAVILKVVASAIATVNGSDAKRFNLLDLGTVSTAA
jgi:hypothetical protein